jgi:1-deoxy-D-xylulose-5-phosphate reductoisomerase
MTAADALRHPTWSMGSKITIDSATMMNKGFEIVEAAWLFGVPSEKIKVVVHRESIIHSMVRFGDGSVIAQLGTPDMRLPIQLAMTYPERKDCIVDPLDLTMCSGLTFSHPDMDNFPCLRLARDCAKKGGNACAAMNGANEEAVALFLQDRIGFYDIYDLVSSAVEAVPFIQQPTLDDILETDGLARQFVRNQANI